jgi:hypothetical protein
MTSVIQLGDLQVDAAALAELCGRYSVLELSVLAPPRRIG